MLGFVAVVVGLEDEVGSVMVIVPEKVRVMVVVVVACAFWGFVS